MIDWLIKRLECSIKKIDAINYSKFILFFFTLFFTLVTTQQQPQVSRRTVPSSDDLYILLDEISVFSCRGSI